MATRIKENYLKALYHLHHRDPNISISDLGTEMGLSKPTVNDMVKKLEAKGWLKYQKYKPLQLTKEGLLIAALIIRKHRLSEMFLTKMMSFGWEEVHDIAEELEHIKSDAFFDRMDELLGFPTRDPHGSPIPDKSGAITELDYQILSTIVQGSTVTFKALRDSSSKLLQYLNKKSLALGTTITVMEKEAFDGSMTIRYGGQEVVLSDAVAKRLLVEC